MEYLIKKIKKTRTVNILFYVCVVATIYLTCAAFSLNVGGKKNVAIFKVSPSFIFCNLISIVTLAVAYSLLKYRSLEIKKNIFYTVVIYISEIVSVLLSLITIMQVSLNIMFSNATFKFDFGHLSNNVSIPMVLLIWFFILIFILDKIVKPADENPNKTPTSSDK